MGLLLLALLLLLVTYRDGLYLMARFWQNDEYNHGYIIPFASLYFIWLKSGQLATTPFEESWAGLLVVLAGVALYLLGELSALYTLIQYGFLLTLYGVLLSFMGWQAFRLILGPLAILLFMVPLPAFLYNSLSSHLQLISSQLGVAVIRAFGISVYLEGNVIDLGQFKLQVVESCSGLRYLFPLAALGFIAAYIYKGAMWKRVVVFLSSMPITVLMNSFRIGVIGVLVEYWGPSMAEGFLHDFEGWIIFMVCAVILLLEMWLFSKVGRDRMPFSKAFAIDRDRPAMVPGRSDAGWLSQPFYLSLLLLAGAATASQLLPNRAEIVPSRHAFKEFPEQIGVWKGDFDQLEFKYIRTLKFDDYLLADYADPSGDVVNFYVAYYGSQRKGASAHSPKACLPGGGWEIQEFGQRELDGIDLNGLPIRVNRVVMQLGDARRLVYYWFQQRGRVITNEYLVKWYIFWDALTRHRTDGALVRLTSEIRPGQDPKAVDRLLSDFLRGVNGELVRYIPN